MQQVAADTYRLGTRGHNFYVLKEGDRATIVDAGCRNEWKKLIAGLESVGLSLAAVAGIVATHSHADHFGLAKRATDNGVVVAVHEDEATRAAGTYRGRYAVSASELPLFNIHALRTFLPMIVAGVLKLDHVAAVETFEDGETLDLPGSLVAIHTPGHTEGHTMFHSPDRGLLFTGDGLITMDLIGPERGPQMIERRFNLDDAMAHASLDRIIDLEASLILPGHGEPWPGSPAGAVALVRG